MGIQSVLVVAKADEVSAVAASPQPTSHWQGLSFTGLENVTLCTLICLVRTGHADRGFDELLDRVQVVASDADQSSDVWLVPGAEVAALARITSLEEEAFEALPGQTYVKGFLRTYADYLGLDGQLFVDEYNSRHIERYEELLFPRRRAGSELVSGLGFMRSIYD